jgi:hypothetical protein
MHSSNWRWIGAVQGVHVFHLGSVIAEVEAVAIQHFHEFD